MVKASSEAFGDLFDTFERSAFRLETLPVYTVPQEAEAFRAFMAGRRLPARTPDNNEWLRLIAETTAAGKRWYKVHLVERPHTDYLRFEFMSYAQSATAGQEIFIADRAAHPDLAGLTEDFWLFDDETVVRMRYDDEGHFLDAERAQAGHLDEYLRRRDVAMEHAVPFKEYTAKHGDRLTA